MLRMELLCATTGQRHHEFGAKEINRNFYHLEKVSPCYLFYSKHDFLNTIKNIYKTLNSPIFPNFRSQISSHLRSSPQGVCVCVYKYIYIHKKKNFQAPKSFCHIWPGKNVFLIWNIKQRVNMNMAEYTKLTEFFGPCASKRGKRDIHKHITVSPYNKRKTLSWRHC